jgi:hypothetical protein
MAYNLSITQKEAITLLELLQLQKAFNNRSEANSREASALSWEKTASESVEHESSLLPKF